MKRKAMTMRNEIEDSMSAVTCPDCFGKRLKSEVLAVTVGGLNISDFCNKSVTDALEFAFALELTEREHLIGDRILKEIRERLGFLKNVGLSYLTLARPSGTLSGGGKPADPPCHSNRLLPHGCALYLR